MSSNPNPTPHWQFYAIRNDQGRWFGGIALVHGHDFPLFEADIKRALPYPTLQSAQRAIERYGLEDARTVPVDVDQAGPRGKTRVVRETSKQEGGES